MNKLTKNFLACFGIFMTIFSTYSHDATASNYSVQTFEGSQNVSLDKFLNESIIIDDRVYIQPGLVFLGPNEILLKLDGMLLQIQKLSSDENGLFLPLEDILMGTYRSNNTWPCPDEDCGYINYDGVDYCGVCGTYRYANKKTNLKNSKWQKNSSIEFR